MCAPEALAADEPSSSCASLPAEGRETKARARLTKLGSSSPRTIRGVTFDYINQPKTERVSLYETFPTQAALDSQTKTVLPAFAKEHGANAGGIVGTQMRSSFTHDDRLGLQPSISTRAETPLHSMLRC